MISFKHGTGISMVSATEFTELNNIENQNNEFIQLSDKIDELNEILKTEQKDSKNKIEKGFNFSISVCDPLIFDKIEQIINSFSEISLRVSGNEVVIKTSEFVRNESPTSQKLPHFLKLFWFIRNSLLRNIYKLSLKMFKMTGNDAISFEKLGFIPKNLDQKLTLAKI